MRSIIICLFASIFLLSSCKKDPKPPVASTKVVVYAVKGTHFKLNFIDSNSVFVKELPCTDSFTYKFRKGSGASIGISVYNQNPSDKITSWSVEIDGKLYANAFSEGGAYLNIPY